MREISGLAEIADRYDAFLIDQFGVLHDGGALYPGALSALEGLHRLGKPVAILTNSGKRSAANRARVLAFGVRADLFKAVLSSGEVAWNALSDGEHGTIRSAFIVGRSGDDYAFDDLGFKLADAAERSNLILILGSNVPATSLDDYRAILAPASAKRILALCCNPDRQMLTASGLLPGPGAIAAVYEELGGPIAWIGKPFPPIYRHAVKLLGDPDPSRTLSIGDSIAHDVRGGHDAGLANALVRTGVSAPLDEEGLKSAMMREGVEPDWILPELRWN
jgi:HAD superfamily hydrolase (TIGR01459 family)